MINTPFFVVATLTASALATPGVLARPVDGDGSVVATESIVWPEGVTDARSLSWVQKHRINAYDEDKKDLLKILFEAHMATQHGSREQAERKIGEAAEQAQDLAHDEADIRMAYSPSLTKLVELKYGSVLSPVLVYIPVADDDLAVEDFVVVLDIKAIDRGAVEDAKVRYVTLELDREKLVHDLNEARLALTSGDFDDARDQIVDAQQSLIANMAAAPSPQVAARDNVSLTRFMLKAAEYEGAREALKAAERALVSLADDKDVVGRSAPEVEMIRKEMRELSGMIERRDPALADQIDKQLEAWWNSLS